MLVAQTKISWKPLGLVRTKRKGFIGLHYPHTHTHNKLLRFPSRRVLRGQESFRFFLVKGRTKTVLLELSGVCGLCRC